MTGQGFPRINAVEPEPTFPLPNAQGGLAYIDGIHANTANAMKPAHLVALLVLLLNSTPCSAQRSHPTSAASSGGALHPAQAAYDVTHYDIRLQVFPDEQRISGQVDVHLTILDPVDYLLLDLEDDMNVAGVDVRIDRDAWREVVFDHSSGRLRVESDLAPGDRPTVRVLYAGKPRVAPNPPWIGGFTWAETSDGMPWIATSVQMDGADVWLPVKDHPSDKADSVSISITVPRGLTVASNGILRDSQAEADSTTFTWFTRFPISNYNIALNIAPYEEISTTYQSIDGTHVPVSFWVLPERLADGRRLLPHFLDQLRWFEETIGPYPFRAEKYGVAHTPHLGMEHQSIIAYGSTFLPNEWGYDWLHQHELAHEWWSNLVTAPDWNDFWIHEGFGTYMQPLYVEHLHGPEAYRREMDSMRRHLNNLSPVAPRDSRSTREMYFIDGTTQSDNDIYYKGSWFLHTLRFLIGDELFFESLQRFAYPDEAARAATDGSQVRFATTEDYRALVEDLADTDLDWLFEVYLRRADLPDLRVKRDAGTLKLRWEAPDDLPFPMPVEVDVDGERRLVEVGNGMVEIRVPASARVTIDPDDWVLRVKE